MDITALSNSLFVNNPVTMPGLIESVAKPAARPQQKSPAVELEDVTQDETVVAEQGQTAGNENVQFKEALNEQTQKQDKAESPNKGTTESDKSTPGSAEKSDSQTTVVQSTNPDVSGLGKPVSISQVISQNAASVNSGEGGKEEVVATAGNAEQLVAKVLNEGNSEGQQVKASTTTAENTEQVMVKVKGESESAQLNMNSEQAEVKAQPEGVKPEANQNQADVQQGVVNEAAKQVRAENSEGVEASQAKAENETGKAEATDILKDNTEAGVKSSPQVQTQATKGGKEQPNVEQAVSELNGQIKSATEKPGSQDKGSASLTSQQNNTAEAFINTDATVNIAEKGFDSAKSVLPETLDLGQQVFTKASEQIQASISNSLKQGESELTVNLNPPELGRVVIKLQQDNGQITGLLEFSKAETKSEVQQLLPQLVRNLQDAGIAVKKLGVVQTQVDTSGHQQFREHVAGDGLAYQQQFSHGQSANSGFGYDWVWDQSAYGGAESLAESYISDEAVNVLV